MLTIRSNFLSKFSSVTFGVLGSKKHRGLNLSNWNAVILFRMLNLFIGMDGNIAAEKMKPMIAQARAHIKDFIVPPEQMGEFYDHGVSEEQLTRYLDELDNLCNAAMTTPLKIIQWR